MEFLSKYQDVRKMLAAVVGTALMVLAPHFDVVSMDAIAGVSSDVVVSAVLAILTVFGVYRVPNGDVESEEEVA